MSFKSAMRGTQRLQNQLQDEELSRKYYSDVADIKNKYADRTKKFGDIAQLTTGLASFADTAGKNLSNFSKNVKFAEEQGLKSNSLLDMINPFKDGIGARWSGEGIDSSLTASKIGKTRAFMKYSDVMGLDSDFKDIANIYGGDDIQAGLLSYLNKKTPNISVANPTVSTDIGGATIKSDVIEAAITPAKNPSVYDYTEEDIRNLGPGIFEKYQSGQINDAMLKELFKSQEDKNITNQSFGYNPMLEMMPEKGVY